MGKHGNKNSVFTRDFRVGLGDSISYYFPLALEHLKSSVVPGLLFGSL